MTALISKLKFNTLYLHLHGRIMVITMHTEVVIHLMNAYCGVGAKSVAHLMKFYALTMGSYESKILNKF